MAEAYTKKPKGPPTFDLKAFTNKLVAGQPITATQQQQFIAWKQWVESTNVYDGVEAGGLKDILNALCIAVDKVKVNVDGNGARLNIHAQEIDEIKGWIAAQPRPFP